MEIGESGVQFSDSEIREKLVEHQTEVRLR